MDTAREQHATALLFNGTVLVAGGFSGSATSFTPNASAEIYDPFAGTFRPTGSSTQALVGFLSPVPVLSDGSVFVAQGSGPGTVQIYSPTTGTFRVTGNMSASQFVPQTALLPDGTVLLVGGQLSFPGVSSSAEIFYPANTVPISITSVLPTALLNVPYTQQLQEKGVVGALTWTVSTGTLPTGLTLSSTGLLSGTPTTVGVSQFTVQVTDSSAPPRTSSTNFIVAVVPPLTVLPTLPTANPGVAYNQSILAAGAAPPLTFALTARALPTRLTIAGNRTLARPPTSVGTFTFTLQVTDSSPPRVVVTQTVSLPLPPPLPLVTSTLPQSQVATPSHPTLPPPP